MCQGCTSDVNGTLLALCEEGETTRDLWVAGTQLARTQVSDLIAVGSALPSFGLPSCEIEY